MYTVPLSPKVIASIGALLQLFEPAKHPYCRTPFEDTHQFRNGYFRRHLYDQMHMSLLHIQSFHLTTLLIAEQLNVVFHFFLNCALQHFIPKSASVTHSVSTKVQKNQVSTDCLRKKPSIEFLF